MKTILPMTCLALLLSTPGSHAQTTTTRLIPPTITPGETAGAWSGSAAIGGGLVALGSPRARNTHGDQTGAVYLFDERTGHPLPTLYPPDGMTGSGFGQAVAISGQRLVVGAPYATVNGHANAGAVLVFDLTTRRLIQRLADGFFFTGEQAGMALAMEGGMVAIGAPYADFGRGHASGAVLFWRVGDTVSSGLLLHPDGEAMDLFGHAVAYEGGLLAVGAPKDRIGGAVGAGSVQLYDTASLQHLAGLNGAAGGGLGASVALDGNLLVAGAPASSANRGKISVWSLLSLTAPTLIGSAPGDTEGERLGVAISARQGLIAVGAPGAGSGGRVRFFNRQLDSVMAAAEPFELSSGDGFGSALALGTHNLVVSAPGDDTRVLDSGAVWRVSRLPRLTDGTPVTWALTSGDPAPGVFGATHGALREVAGTMTSPAAFSGLNGAGRATTGLWTDFIPGRSFGLLARTGAVDPMGRQFTRFSNLLPHAIGDTIYFRARQAGVGIGPANADSLQRLSAADGSLNTLLAAGSMLADGSQIATLGEARLSNASDILTVTAGLRRGTGFPVVTNAADSALVITSNGRVSVALREGVDLAPIGSVYGQMPRTYAVSADRGFGVFTAQASPGSGVSAADDTFVMDNGVVAAREGGLALDASGMPVGFFSTFTGACGDARGVVFHATLRRAPGVTSANNEGLWCNRSGESRLILRKGQSAPVIGGGVTVRRFLRHGMNRSGHLLILAQVAGPGVTRANDLVLYWNRGDSTPAGAFEVLLREGAVVPGTGGARLSRIVEVDFTSAPEFSNSHYGALVTLAAQRGVVSSADNLVWLAGSAAVATPTDSAAARRPVTLLRKGTFFAHAGRLETLRSFAPGTRLADATGCLNSGRSHVLGAYFGRSTLRAKLSGNRQVAVVMDR